MNIEEKAEQFRNTFESIKYQIHKRIVGLDEIIDYVLSGLFIGGHVLLESVPGLGKTLLVKSLSEAVDLQFSRIQFTPDLMPADILGTNIILELSPGQKSFQFQKGPVFSNVLLADEINRATPKTQSALLEAMQERSVTIAGKRHELEEPFYVLATQNPIEMEGTYPLPEAQVDRFLYKLNLPFPGEKDLASILNQTTSEDAIRLEAVTRREAIREFSRFLLQVPAAEAVIQYAVQFILNTHPGHTGAPEFIRQYVRYGSSPRGAQALILSAKIAALRDGRYNASIEDVKSAVLPALRHRIILNIEGQAENVSTDDLLIQLLNHRDAQRGLRPQSIAKK